MNTTKQPTLNLNPNLSDCDGFYDELLQAHEGLSDDESEAFNARLILILCNHIGDRDVLRQALSAAEESVTGSQDRRGW